MYQYVLAINMYQSFYLQIASYQQVTDRHTSCWAEYLWIDDGMMCYLSITLYLQMASYQRVAMQAMEASGVILVMTNWKCWVMLWVMEGFLKSDFRLCK